MGKDRKRMRLRTSLIISVSLVHAVLMGLFVYHSTRESKDLISEEMKGGARSFARMLATTSTNAILSRDISSLHEYVDKTGKERNVSYAIIQDADGTVLAGTGGSFDGLILSDEVSKRAGSSSTELLQVAGNVFDVAVPISLEGKRIGVARVGVSTGEMNQKISESRMNGLKMTLLAILVGAVVAVFVALRVTRGLSSLAGAAGEMTGGDLNTRAHVDSYREVNELAYAFNHMADAIQEREEELQQTIEELDNAHEELQSANEELQHNYEEIEHTNEELQSTTEELQTANEELSWANEKVMEADRLKSEFLANMSHELRTPLNSVIALSDILLARMDGDLTGEQEKQIRIIQKSGKHLLDLINDILDLSKIEAGKMEVHVGGFRIEDVVWDVGSTVTPLASEKGLNIGFTKDEAVPVIWSDRNKVKQILLNLVSNAVKFTPRGGSITIDATHRDGSLEIKVIDTGIGIGRENLEKIFDEFRQVDGSYTREYGGTGLGLAITRRLVRLLGGDIGVESEAGKGSVFTVNIPIVLDEAAAGLGRDELRIDPDRKTILAVDDDPSAIYILKRYLEEDGYQVIPAHSGEEALRLARELRPFAITLDIMIPGKDGWDVMKELKSDPATEHIPVVVVSILDNKTLGFSLGATECLTKPVERDTVLNALMRLMPLRCIGVRNPEDCPVRILLVDDDPVHIMAMKAVLSERGYVVMVAPGGREAIEMLRETAPCAIILDIMMPEVDGFMVVEEVKKRRETRDIPVIILTAKDITDEDRKRLNGSIQDIVKKGSFAQEEILEDIKNIFGRRLHIEQKDTAG
jgi:signal transduction histidine kinase/DNA-binding response OmpR family regulator